MGSNPGYLLKSFLLYLQDDVFGLFKTHSFTNSSSCCIRFDDLGRDFGSFIIIFYRESAILTCWKLLQIVLVKGRLNSIAAPTPFRYTPSSSRHGSKNKAIQEKWFAPYEYVALEFNSLNMCDKFELEFSKLSRARLGLFQFSSWNRAGICFYMYGFYSSIFFSCLFTNFWARNSIILRRKSIIHYN